jgi:hypothetical protein
MGPASTRQYDGAEAMAVLVAYRDAVRFALLDGIVQA